MGQRQSYYLSKFTVRDENDRIKFAASSMQGLCSYRHETRTTYVDLDLDGIRSTAFFGVYDGHGGATVAHHCASRFHTELKQDEYYQNNLDNAVRRVFFRMDEQLKELDEFRASANPPRFSFNLLRRLKTAASVKGPGSTACVAVIRGHQIIVGNVGNSRCVLSRGRRAMDLSTDHKPNLPGECQRIQNAGGRVTKPYRFAGRVQSSSYRVNGSLAMSRAIGDFHFKSNTNLDDIEQMVTCNPDVRIVDITEDADFLLIASDGIWDILSSDGAVNFVNEKLASEMTLPKICEELLNHCVKSKDNSTVILVQFKPAARIPPPPAQIHPPAPPAVQASAVDTSQDRNPVAGTEVKVESSSEIMEDEKALISSVNNNT